MAATAPPSATAPPRTVARDDAPPRRGAPDASLEGFDDLFVQPVDPQDDRGSLATLPDGWHHAGLVELVARQPRERRETLLAGGFALVAVLWAPLGVFAFMTRNGLVFGALSLAAAVLAAAPRPATVSTAVGELAERAAPVRARVRPAIAATRERLAPAMSRTRGVGDRALPVLQNLGDRVLPVLRSLGERVLPALRDARDRAAPVLLDVGRRTLAGLQHLGQRMAAGVRSADRRVSSAVRRGLEGIQGGGRDHSTPSSAR